MILSRFKAAKTTQAQNAINDFIVKWQGGRLLDFCLHFGKMCEKTLEYWRKSGEDMS